MKKILVFLFIFCTFFLLSCSSIKERIPTPSISVKNIKLKKVTLKDMTLSLILDLYNPYPVGGTVRYIKGGGVYRR